MDIYLVDGTYELFRHFFAVPSRSNAAGREIAAVRGVVGSILSMLESGNTHVGVATDHVVESFRNDLWSGYKTGSGIDPELFQQFPLLEDSLRELGVPVWPMVELEADDVLAAAAKFADSASEVKRVYICSPDKDLAQCVRNQRVLQLDRRSGKVADEAGVIEKFGVRPESVPDYLALVGDSADGFPGLPGWGSRGSATILARYGHLEAIPPNSSEWDVTLRGAAGLSTTLNEGQDIVLLFRDLATLRDGESPIASVDELRWHGPKDSFEEICRQLDAASLYQRAVKLAARRLDGPQA